MNPLFVLLLFLVSMSPVTKTQEVFSVVACFDSYVQGFYYFVDIEGTTYEFQGMDPSAKEKYDLTDGSCQGRMFTVVYRMDTTVYEKENEEGEEDNDEYPEYIIVDLEIIG